jgi:FMN phosphatase YigB (HAD superfamily)
MGQLPFWKHVVFVDWHGVLSRDPFWTSIRNSDTHPLRPQLDAKISEVFANASANEWMLGNISSLDVISDMEIWLDRRFREDFLLRRLHSDCARMRVNVELFQALHALKSRAIVVLATDNMDCFSQTFNQARSRSRQPVPESETLANWAVICDDIICSSDVGALKADNPTGFFGPWLSQCGLDFTDALLIDDRADNCDAFREQGGSAVQWKMGKNDVSEVINPADHWLRSSSQLSHS